eukprot:Nk52_evm26s359 gene=Nk52_evmTU26s359
MSACILILFVAFSFIYSGGKLFESQQKCTETTKMWENLFLGANAKKGTFGRSGAAKKTAN